MTHTFQSSYPTKGYSSERFDSFVLSNAILSASDASFIRDHVLPNTIQAISVADIELGHLDTLIARATAERCRVLEDKSRLEAMKTRCRTCFSAVRYLPVEILSDIFQHHIAVLANSKSGLSIFEIFRLPAFQVCTRWRAIARSTPTLWTWIDFGNLRRLPTMWESVVPRGISQSNGRPLSFKSEGVAPTTPDTALEIIRHMLPHATRWQDARLVLVLNALVVLENPNYQFPMLESLSLSIPAWSSWSSRVSIQAFESAPSLRHIKLRIERHPHYRSFISISLPFAQLKSVQLWTSAPDDDLQQLFLSNCSQLDTFESGCRQDWRPYTGLEPSNVVSSPIRSLTIDAASFPTLFCLVAPYLRTLRVHSDFDITILQDFLGRSKSPLTDLHLHATVSDRLASRLDTLFGILPDLRELRVTLLAEHTVSMN